MELPIREYLGDGLYVAFTGYSYELSVNDHRNPVVASFEANHIDNFVEFKNNMEALVKSIRKQNEQEKTTDSTS